MANITRVGYGQVEFNHMSAQKTGQIYAQLPATGIAQLENGQFAKYDYAAGKVDLTGEAEWMLVYNEEQLYDERKQNRKDYVALAANNVDGVIYPRLYKTNVGDIFTTNTLGKPATSADGTTDSTLALNVKDFLKIDTATGFLTKGTANTDPAPLFQVVALTTMPDGQAAVKVQRVK